MAATTLQLSAVKVSLQSLEKSRLSCPCRHFSVCFQSQRLSWRNFPEKLLQSPSREYNFNPTKFGILSSRSHYSSRSHSQKIYNADSARNALSKRLSPPPEKVHGGLPSLRSKKRNSVIVNVLPSGGPGGEPSRSLGKYLGWATWGLIIWSALRGRLNWFFEGLTAISLAILAIPVLLLLAFLGVLAWAQSRQIEGLCPTCGTDLSVVKWADNMVVVANSIPVQLPANEDDSFDCPNCRASLKVESKKIFRGRPSFETVVDSDPFDVSQMFGGRKPQSSGKSSAASQPVVDIEAEVLEKD